MPDTLDINQILPEYEVLAIEETGEDNRGSLASEAKTPHDTLDLNNVLSYGEASDPPYNQKKDNIITWLAIFVIGTVALVSALALILREVCPERFTGTSDWPVDMLTLALVSSLSFVMGSNVSEK